jgi:uncharacterized membrane protein (UPF0127 family)
MTNKILVLGLFLIIFLGVGLLSFKQPSIKILISPEKTLQLELAESTEEHMRGLMFRKFLAADHGMLFVYPKLEMHRIWMKNTLIPLDLIWLDKNKKIIYFIDNVPICKHEPCPIYSPPEYLASQYVIEINAGMREKLNLQYGQILNF